MHQSDRSWLVEMLITLEPQNIFGSNIAYVYESFYKNEGVWEEKKQKINKNNTAYFDSFSFQTLL